MTLSNVGRVTTRQKFERSKKKAARRPPQFDPRNETLNKYPQESETAEAPDPKIAKLNYKFPLYFLVAVFFLLKPVSTAAPILASISLAGCA
jgi:hypothetical protein